MSCNVNLFYKLIKINHYTRHILDDYPELTDIVKALLKEKNIDMPSKAPSQVDVQSVRSRSSISSVRSGGR